VQTDVFAIRDVMSEMGLAVIAAKIMTAAKPLMNKPICPSNNIMGMHPMAFMTITMAGSAFLGTLGGLWVGFGLARLDRQENLMQTIKKLRAQKRVVKEIVKFKSIQNEIKMLPEAVRQRLARAMR
jgi:hypothetical protein